MARKSQKNAAAAWMAFFTVREDMQWRREMGTKGGGHPPRAALCMGRNSEGQKYGILKFCTSTYRTVHSRYQCHRCNYKNINWRSDCGGGGGNKDVCPRRQTPSRCHWRYVNL